MKPIAAAVLAAFSAVPTGAFAVTPTETELDPVIVTATRQTERVSETLADVTVVSREEIERAGASTVLQLLARQPGVQTTMNGGPGTNSALYIRGASNAQSLVLIDGQRFGSATAGGASLQNLSLDQIDHIEILRGPASALYGSDAVGGVVQIFTRRGEGPVVFDGFAGIGRYNTQNYSVGASGSECALRFNLQAAYNTSDSFSATNSELKQPYNYDPDKDGYRNAGFNGSVAWAFVPGHEIELNALSNQVRSHYDARETDPLTFAPGPGYDAYADSRAENYGLTLRDQFTSAWRSTLRSGRSVDNYRDYAPWAPTGQTFKTTQDQVSWQNDIKAEAAGKFMLGAEWLRQRAEVEVDAYGEPERTTRTAFGGWGKGFGEHDVQLNLRYDDSDDYGGHTSGTAAWAWHFLPQWRARLSAGNSFRAPTFNDLYYPFFSNPDLQPERGRSADAALNWDGQSMGASLTYYRTRIKDMIALDQNFLPQNIARAEIDGVTLTARGEWSGWELNGSLDWLDARDGDTDKQLAHRAKWQGMLSGSYGVEAWRAGAELQAVGKRYDDPANLSPMGGYGQVNLFAQWKFTREAQLEARVDNLFDKQYEKVAGYGTPGVSVFAGVRVSTR
ncbi:TonB-dependent receptor [Niveibacterium sp. SC-1]|uniref:TonB-dependent receptor domain-containing protein n=1 Tax=Niveibacterium sp. SC-1 TaxID=3135646 RepID=UPI00311F7D7B